MRTCLKRWLVAAAFAALVAQASTVAAQTETGVAAVPALVELRLIDGSVIYGTIQTETPARIVVQTIAGGTVDVERATVASMRPARGQVVNGEFLPADSNATRLLFGPTGRSLAKGQGYVGVYEFVLPFVQVGITDRFSMGVGTPLVFFEGESGRPVWLTPKYQVYHGGKTDVALGVMHFLLAGENARYGLAYGVATRGTENSALTIGAGWAYARYHEDQVTCVPRGPGAPVVCSTTGRTTENAGSPVVMIGGEHRVSRRLKLVTENYVFNDGGILLAGVRFLGERLTADLGVMVPVTDDDFVIFLPAINFVWTFGK